MSDETSNRCESCGLLMLDDDEHGAGNPANPRCRICTRPDGSFLSFEQTLMSHVLYLRSKSGAGAEDAERAAREILEGNPAWNRKDPESPGA